MVKSGAGVYSGYRPSPGWEEVFCRVRCTLDALSKHPDAPDIVKAEAKGALRGLERAFGLYKKAEGGEL